MGGKGDENTCACTDVDDSLQHKVGLLVTMGVFIDRRHTNLDLPLFQWRLIELVA